MSSIEKSIAIIPKVGGCLSLIGCTLIMRDVFVRWRKKKAVPLTSVVVFCISVCYWFYSFFSAFMSTWMAPKDSGAHMASGNTQTCTAQGFITLFMLAASMIYYTVLMILYWMIVKFGWTERHMRQWKVRLPYLLTAPIVSLVLAVPPLFYGLYNYSGGFTCFIAPNPSDCDHNLDMTCGMSEVAWRFWDVFMAMAIVCNLVIVIFVILLVTTIYKQERKNDRYTFRGQDRKRENTIMTAWQGFRYTGAFTIAYLPTYIIMVYQVADNRPQIPNVVTYMQLILNPLLGFLNAFVYFRPRYIQLKRGNPDKDRASRLSSIFNVDLSVTARLSKLRWSFNKTDRSDSGLLDANNDSEGQGGCYNNSNGETDLLSTLHEDVVESRDESLV